MSGQRGEEPRLPGARPGPVDTLTLGNLGAAQDVRQHDRKEKKEKRKESENGGWRGCLQHEKGRTRGDQPRGWWSAISVWAETPPGSSLQHPASRRVQPGHSSALPLPHSIFFLFFFFALR